MHFLVKWIKFSVKKNKTLKKYWKNGPKYWKSQGILSVRKSGNPVLGPVQGQTPKVLHTNVTLNCFYPTPSG